MNRRLFDPVTSLRFQSNVADVQALHSSECSEQEEEELVTQAEISKD